MAFEIYGLACPDLDCGELKFTMRDASNKLVGLSTGDKGLEWLRLTIEPGLRTGIHLVEGQVTMG